MNEFPPSRSHEEASIDGLRNDPEYACAYVQSVLADGDREELALALRRIAAAFVPGITLM